MLASLNNGARAAGGPIKIGSALPMSGFAAADGIEFKNGLTLAAEEINAAGGILGRPIQIEVEDTKEMGADVVTQAMQRLIDRHSATAIINGYNVGTNMVEMDVAADNDVIFVHYNTLISHNTKFLSDPQRYYSCFRAIRRVLLWSGLSAVPEVVDRQQAVVPAEQEIAIIPSANEYSIVIANAIRDRVKEFGFELGLYETVPFPTNQWGPTLAKLRQDPPAAIAVTHFLPQDLAQFMVQFLPEPTQSLVSIRSLASGLPRDRQGSDQRGDLLDRDRLSAR